MDAGDLELQLLVADRPRRRRPLLCDVVGVRGDLAAVLGEHPADRLDPETVPVLVDVGDYLFGWRSSSAPKKAAADLRISFARRSSFTSRSSSLMLRPLVGREPGPVTGVGLGSAHPDPQRLVVEPSLAEIDSIAFHCDGYSCWCSSTIRTARSRTSAG